MNRDRRQAALDVRKSAAELANARPHPRHIANGDEQRFRRKDGSPSYMASFTKGLKHNKKDGLVKHPEDFQKFVKAIDSGDPRDFRETPLGPGGPWQSGGKAEENGVGVRAWESQSAGLAFDLEGPDAQAVTMPPAPAIGSEELGAEIAEVYAQALLRDVPFTTIVKGRGPVSFDANGGRDTTVQGIFQALNQLPWFQDGDLDFPDQNAESRRRGEVDGGNAFRGITRGDNVGPYISQFLLAGNRGIGEIQKRSDGFIGYGAIRIDQRVRVATPYQDHMTTWADWLDVQNGADVRGLESYEGKRGRDYGASGYRFITTPRDLATYVHFDALYEAYLNACLILLGENTPFDPDIPFQGTNDAEDHQQGFAHFGGPHILSLVTEVATRALKAVRYQKFNVHRRLRPEALAARFARHGELQVKELEQMLESRGLQKILDLIARKNGDQDPILKDKNYLLPMAFCEGSPMHPTYGAGHATVAGACVTVLKAFFDHNQRLSFTGDPTKPAFVPDATGKSLKAIKVEGGPLTVEGELNKLASNISIGRDWAGVHYYSDYIESLRMGEQIAIGILEEQKLTYGENFSMTIPLFDGGSIRI